MDVSSRGIQYAAGTILFLCGCLQAVTINPLPYEGNEGGFRLPRGTATFLDQEEGSRIRREMMAGRGTAGFYGGNDYDRRNYDKRSYDEGNRYYDNEIDRDVYQYHDKPRDYYPNYNPQGSHRHDQFCDPRGGSYDNVRGLRGGGGGGGGGQNWDYKMNRGRGGYDDRDRGGYDRVRGGNNGGRNRGYEERGRGQYDKNRGGGRGEGGGGGKGGGRGEGGGGGGDGRGYNQWGNNYENRNNFDNIGEGTVGFYGRSRHA